MFGYVRPLKGELRVWEYESFRAQYCGLCLKLGRKYGFAAKFILNYDIAFFAAALSGIEGGTEYEHHRCIASPFRKKCMACPGAASVSQELAADLTVILTYWKLCDEISDSGPVKGLPARFLRAIYSRAYKKAKRERPELCGAVQSSIKALAALEKDGCDSVDMCADTFAAIMSASAAEFSGDIKIKRILTNMFYHIGRWIYIIDACDDYERDIEKEQFNPVRLRYGLSSPVLPDEIKEEVEITLSHSIGAACAAYELIDFGPCDGLVSNVLHLGLEMVTKQVMSGEWKRRGREDSPHGRSG